MSSSTESPSNNRTVDYVDPLYIKHSDLRFIQRRITATLLCSAIDNFLHFSATVGAQKKKYCWELYAQNEKARGSIAENGFTLYERQIKVFNENPINTNPSEKLTIKDLPMELSDDDILQHLVNTYPEHKFISRVMKSKDEISRYRFSKYLTGDRYVYIQAPYPCQFPKHGVIASFSCRFWHSTQDGRCKRCNSPSHSTREFLSCPAYRDNQNIRIIRDPNDPLCNFYTCDMKYRNIMFCSSEHAYQFHKCKFVDNEDAASAVLHAATPKLAKEIASKIPDNELGDWNNHKDVVMHDILMAKLACVPTFQQALLDSDKSFLVEATSHLYWACGLDPELASTTCPDYYRGSNVFGYVLSKVRASLLVKNVHDISDTSDVDGSIASANDDRTPDDITSPRASLPDSMIMDEKSIAGTPKVTSNIESDQTLEVCTTSNAINQSPELDATTPSTQIPTDTPSNDHLLPNVRPPLLSSESEDPNEQFITPLLTPATSTGDMRDVGQSHDVLSKQLFCALSGLIPSSKGSPKVTRKKISRSARPTNSHTPEITSYFDGPSKRKASSDLPSPPASQRANCDVSPDVDVT